jgi:hypothetical protein
MPATIALPSRSISTVMQGMLTPDGDDAERPHGRPPTGGPHLREQADIPQTNRTGLNRSGVQISRSPQEVQQDTPQFVSSHLLSMI